MPAPATTLQWATDATFTNGPATIPGTNTKVAPSAGQIAEGHIPQDKLPAQHENWWKNLVGQWVQWLESERSRLAGYIGGSAGTDEWVYDAGRTRTIWVNPSEFTLGGSNMTRRQGGAIYSSADPAVVRKNVDGGIGYAWLNLNRYLPANCTLTRVRVPVIFDNTGTAPTLEMTLDVQGVDADNWVASGTTHYDSQAVLGTSLSGSDASARYLMDSGVISQSMLSDNANPGGKVLRFEITGVDQEIYGAELTFTDLGVKNT